MMFVAEGSRYSVLVITTVRDEWTPPTRMPKGNSKPSVPQQGYVNPSAVRSIVLPPMSPMKGVAFVIGDETFTAERFCESAVLAIDGAHSARAAAWGVNAIWPFVKEKLLRERWDFMKEVLQSIILSRMVSNIEKQFVTTLLPFYLRYCLDPCCHYLHPLQSHPPVGFRMTVRACCPPPLPLWHIQGLYE